MSDAKRREKNFIVRFFHLFKVDIDLETREQMCV